MVQERNVLAAFLQNVRVAAMDADHMMDVGAIDHFLFPGGPVVGLHPQVVAVCPGALTANGLIRKEAVIAADLIEPGDGYIAALDLVEAFPVRMEPLTPSFFRDLAKGPQCHISSAFSLVG